MKSKKTDTGAMKADSIANKKTFQDFNNKQPDLNDPNETKAVVKKNGLVKKPKTISAEGTGVKKKKVI